MVQQEPRAVQYGFDAPSVTAHHQHSAHADVNPAALLGYATTASGMASPFAAPTGGGGGGVGMYGSSSVLSDADLDLENILASFNNAASAQESAGGTLPQGYMAQSFAGLQSGLRHQSPLPPVNENGGQQPAADAGDFFSQPPPKPRRGSSNEYGTPGTNTTYGASPSDTFTTPSTSSKRSVSQERTGRLGRSSSVGGVGKAPRQTSRSRSARRTSSAATAGYQDRTEAKERGRDRERSTQRGEVVDKASPASNLGTPGASAAATPGANSTSNPPPPAAVGIPTASAATMPPPHPYAMSMPAFVHPASYGAHAASMPTHAVNGGWFPHPHPSSAGAVPLPGMHHHPALAAGGAAFASQHFMAPNLQHHPHHPMAFDPLTGWRPTVGPMPASAPSAADPGAARPTNPPSSSATTTTTATTAAAASASKKDAVPAAPPANTSGSKKNKGLEDVQEEDDGKGEPLTDKRRKRRESHNAVERRRRDNINDRIAELASLLPEAFQVGAPQPPPPLSASSATRDEPNGGGGGGPGSPAIGSLSLMSPGPFGSGSPTSFHSVSGAAYMAAAAASSSAQQQKATTGLSAQAQAAAQKPNKGAVLAKSVDYIRYLQQIVELQQQQAAELQRQNAELRRAVEASPSPPPLLSSSHSKYLPPQPPCFPPHVHSVSASTDTSASVSRQAGSPVGGGGGGSRSAQYNKNVSTRNGGKRRSGGGGGSASWALYDDDCDDRDAEGDDYRSADDHEDPDDDRDDDRGGGDGGGAFTPECEGPDGIDCEKGWDAMLAAGGMHVLKMEEDDP